MSWVLTCLAAVLAPMQGYEGAHNLGPHLLGSRAGT